MTRATAAGSFLGLRTGTKPAFEAIGERRSEDEAASLDAENEIDLLPDVVGGEGVDELGEAVLILEQGGDVVEENSRLGEVWNGPDEGLQGLAVEGCFHLVLPGSFDLKRSEFFAFRGGEFMFHDRIDAGCRASLA